MALDEVALLKEWQALSKDWYSIYQWERASRTGYTEQIAGWIDTEFPGIRLATEGLRQRSFRVPDHRGQIKLQTGIEQLTEKRLVRAMYNLTDVPVLGKVIDYEIPLKETDDANHGDIDLLCVQSDVAFCVEAKKPGSNESILKAALQAFVYTLLVATRRAAFLADFAFSATVRLTPAVLTFASAKSGHQLNNQGSLPKLWRLVATLNSALARTDISPIRFFVVENDLAELKTCLMTSAQPNKDEKVVFRDGFTLNIAEYTIK
jgi:hypothetical protein